jgi:hypothetical protein
MPSTEKTAAGEQYVIPGCERIIPAPRPAFPLDGAQLVIPGAERLSDRALAARLMARPLRPRLGQLAISRSPLFAPRG